MTFLRVGDKWINLNITTSITDDPVTECVTVVTGYTSDEEEFIGAERDAILNFMRKAYP